MNPVPVTQEILLLKTVNLTQNSMVLLDKQKWDLPVESHWERRIGNQKQNQKQSAGPFICSSVKEKGARACLGITAALGTKIHSE